eukprot:scaffold200619_cov23-Cyclotella_meneghiniana.AAC.1
MERDAEAMARANDVGESERGCTNYGRLPGPPSVWAHSTLYRLVSECAPTLASWIPYKFGC